MSSDPLGPRAQVLVLALGNPLLRDDGAGREILRELERRVGPDSRVDFVDGGTQGLALLGLLEDRRATILIDAERGGGAPGTIQVSAEPRLAEGPRGSSAHEGNAFELLAAARLTGLRSGPVLLVGIEPQWLGVGVGLSPAVRAALPCAADLAYTLLGEALAGRVGDEVESCTS